MCSSDLKEGAELRAECNGLKATVHVGAHGLTDALIGALDDALRTHELVKVQLGKPVEIPAREAARQLAVATPNLDALFGVARLHASVHGLYPAAASR